MYLMESSMRKNGKVGMYLKKVKKDRGLNVEC